MEDEEEVQEAKRCTKWKRGKKNVGRNREGVWVANIKRPFLPTHQTLEIRGERGGEKASKFGLRIGRGRGSREKLFFLLHQHPTQRERENGVWRKKAEEEGGKRSSIHVV